MMFEPKILYKLLKFLTIKLPLNLIDILIKYLCKIFL